MWENESVVASLLQFARLMMDIDGESLIIQISAGVGMSLTIFVFVSVFFEFDWYHHEKGIDVAALGWLIEILID